MQLPERKDIRGVLLDIASEERDPQIRMANLIKIALEQDKHAIIEAGTGTGKSFAYLIPAILSGKKIIISTANIALQQQLVEFDLPFLAKKLQELYGIRFKFGLLKGRSNYLCQHRFNEAESIDPKLGDWASNTTTGDRSEVDFPIDFRDWRQVCSDRDDCPSKECPYRGEWDQNAQAYVGAECFYYAAKDKLKGATIIVTNHAMVALDLRLGGMIIGNYDALILDEGHQFEQYVLNAWNHEIRNGIVRALCDDITDMFDGDLEIAQTCQKLIEEFDKIFKAIGKLSKDAHDKYRISLVDFRDKAFGMVQDIEILEQRLLQRGAMGNPGEKFDSVMERISKLSDTLLVMSSPYQVNKIAWAETQTDEHNRQHVKIMTGPVHVNSILRKSLFDGDERRMTVITSATISTGGNFEFIKKALGVEADLTMLADSPFDYAENSLLYVPCHLDPQMARNGQWQQYEADLHAEIRNLVELAHGGAFCLFTSNAAMNKACDRLGATFEAMGLAVAKQGDMEKGRIIEWFKMTPNAVLFATASFWEGVSIEGDSLRLVIIDKIPFPGPGDPQRDARADDVKARGGTPFMEMDLPEAIIKLKQGFGRLIRTKRDRGVVAILDNRLHTKRYGRTIINSLPPAPLVTDLAGVDLSRYFVPQTVFTTEPDVEYDPEFIPF